MKKLFYTLVLMNFRINKREFEYLLTEVKTLLKTKFSFL